MHDLKPIPNPIDRKPVKYDPNKHHRRSIRMKGFDYSQPGKYFITICTHQRQLLFGDIVDGVMMLNELGQIVQQCWTEIPKHYPDVKIDEFVVMPNHMHGIITIAAGNDGIHRGGTRVMGATTRHQPQHVHPMQPCGTSQTIGAIVRGFKIGVTKWARQNTNIHTVWQRNYHDQIIWNQQALHNIRRYIIQNPSKWKTTSI